jgi:hypothetical protein
MALSKKLKLMILVNDIRHCCKNALRMARSIFIVFYLNKAVEPMDRSMERKETVLDPIPASHPVKTKRLRSTGGFRYIQFRGILLSPLHLTMEKMMSID